MDPETKTWLLEAIHARRLVVLCGAGLSRTAPSSLPTAYELTRMCVDFYEHSVGGSLPLIAKEDLGKLSAHFVKAKVFQRTFIDTVVPWSAFDTFPNGGHAALADLLGCNVLEFVVSANYDCLIESAARRLGERDFRSAIQPDDLTKATLHRPLLKIHGCCSPQSRKHTIWCVEQLDSEPVKGRVRRLRKWLSTHLQGKDILIVGFWTDWSYLERVLQETLNKTEPSRVVVVDPSDWSALESKAPGMTQWATGHRVKLHHEQLDGAQFLNEVRMLYSEHYISRAIKGCFDTFRELTSLDPPTCPIQEHTSDDLYQLRRSFTGTSSLDIVRSHSPDASQNSIAAVHLAALHAGAVFRNGLYHFEAPRIMTVRLFNGAGNVMSVIRNTLNREPPMPDTPTYTVCVGTSVVGIPNLIGRGVANGFLRNTGSGEWIDHLEFLHIIGVKP